MILLFTLFAARLHGNSLHASADQTQSHATSVPVQSTQLNSSGSSDNSQRASLASAEDLTDSAEGSADEGEDSDGSGSDEDDDEYVVVESDNEVAFECMLGVCSLRDFSTNFLIILVEYI